MKVSGRKDNKLKCVTTPKKNEKPDKSVVEQIMSVQVPYSTKPGLIKMKSAFQLIRPNPNNNGSRPASSCLSPHKSSHF